MALLESDSKNKRPPQKKSSERSQNGSKRLCLKNSESIWKLMRGAYEANGTDTNVI